MSVQEVPKCRPRVEPALTFRALIAVELEKAPTGRTTSRLSRDALNQASGQRTADAQATDAQAADALAVPHVWHERLIDALSHGLKPHGLVRPG